ncbi:unnamed protein product [Leptosia nina]|uniref:Uncharacterized protein n=1 Tax=Leptosia nina TaxID=320188 RepID=A0AAV1JSA4_9NEOP
MVKKYIVVFSFMLLEIYALNCRTEGSLKSDELKRIYNNCARQHEGKNSSNTRNSSEQDWRDRGGQRTENQRNSGRDEREEVKNWMDERRDRMGNKERMGENNDNGYNKDYRQNQGMNGHQYNDYEKQYQNEYDRRDENHDKRMNGNRDSGGYKSTGNYQNDRFNGQDFYQNDEYGSGAQSRNMYSMPSHRYRRERPEKNSGQRSQYNPNTHRSDDYRNSSDSKGGRACAMHCFLDNLQMTGENGMPDRYLVTNAMTKEVRNEDLRDFLQESIEECFQILDNENSEDKCEFSKNLLICLSEKGRATCDDWKEDVQFN